MIGGVVVKSIVLTNIELKKYGCPIPNIYIYIPKIIKFLFIMVERSELSNSVNSFECNYMMMIILENQCSYFENNTCTVKSRVV